MDWSQAAKLALEEHRKLNREVDILRLRLNAPSQESRRRWMTRCVAHFNHFQELLLTHMEMEEDGGFMPIVRERRPTLERRVNALESEHGTIRKACSELQDFFETCTDPTTEDIQQVRRMTGALLDTLRDHENEENKLIQDVLIQDIGTGD